MSDIVLKIDADTQAFIGKLAKLAEEQKKLVKGAEEHGTAMSKVGQYAGSVAQHFVGMLAPLAAVGATTTIISKAIGEWASNIEKTKAALHATGDLLQTILRSGAGPGETKDIAHAAQRANRFLTAESLASGVGAYRAPSGMVGASAAETGRAVGSAQLAHAAGYDTNEYLRVYGRLEAAGVSGKKLPDIAASLLTSSGGDEKELGLIAQHPEQAESVAKLFAALKPQGRQGAALARQALGLYSEQHARGPVDAFFRRQRGTLGTGETSGIFAAGLANLDKQPDIAEGDLEARAAEGAQIRGVGLRAEMMKHEAEEYRLQRFAPAARSATLREGRQDIRSAHGHGGAWAMNLLESGGEMLVQNDMISNSEAATARYHVHRLLEEIRDGVRDRSVREKSRNDEPHR